MSATNDSTNDNVLRAILRNEVFTPSGRRRIRELNMMTNIPAHEQEALWAEALKMNADEGKLKAAYLRLHREYGAEFVHKANIKGGGHQRGSADV